MLNAKITAVAQLVTKSKGDHSVWQKPLFHPVIMRLSQEMRAPWPEINIAGLK
jgi:hypothetical protein